MKLFEMRRHLPKKADQAILTFDLDVETPRRENENILLPADPDADWFPLKKGAQFLMKMDLRIKDENRSGGYRSETQTWFGGTDERPFLVRLKDETYDALRDSGERGFFRHLKPGNIEKLERSFRTPAKRQGDFFAVSLPYDWNAFGKMSALFSDRELNRSTDEIHSLSGTRHAFKGEHSWCYFGGLDGNILVGEGTITAPDHEPLVLECPHVIVQAANLYSPSTAD